MAESNEPPLKVESLAEICTPGSLALSPKGDQVLYVHKNAIWLVDIGKQYSARQITSGNHSDVSPRWSPTTEGLIAFVSDRFQGYTAIHCLRLAGGEAYAIESTKRWVIHEFFEAMEWSPDGKFIAYVCPAEKEPNSGNKTKEPKVRGETWDYNRLSCVHVPARESFSLFEEEYEVERVMAWSADGKDIIFTTSKTPEANSRYLGTSIRRVSLATKKSEIICHFPSAVRNIVLVDSEIYFQGYYEPSEQISSTAIFRILPASTSMESGKSWERCAFGETNGVHSFMGIGDSDVAVLVEAGLRSQLHLHSSRKALQSAAPQVLYDDMHEIRNWAVARTGCALVLTKSDPKNPPELFSVKEGELCQLSQHCQSIAKHKFGEAQAVYCKAEDGTELDGIFFKPASSGQGTPLATLVWIHGGPYSGETVDFGDLCIAPWVNLAGYAVLCPNYRGGSSRGEKFASELKGVCGTLDYSDVISVLKAAIAEGLVDGDKCVIGGGSHGGYLSCLAFTRRDHPLKAAICLSPITDLDMLTMTSTFPERDAELADKAPWDADHADVKTRQNSPIWNLMKIEDKTVPILLLHGTKDERVPFAQSSAFHLGCLKHNIPCTLVEYPGMGHNISNDKFHADMLKRITKFLDTHMK